MNKSVIMAVFLTCASSLNIQAAETIPGNVFDIINLDYPGLESVKKLHTEGKDSLAKVALLDYYRHRSGVVNPSLDMNRISISENEKRKADEALDHTFYVHDGYQPSYNYGADIDWQYWPVKDNELRWQLHRHKWFTPMGKAYRVTGDEKYAREWTLQFSDWIRKNPCYVIDKNEYEMTTATMSDALKENSRFAWRPLEVSHRLADQLNQFQLFLPSDYFTPDFLAEFLVNYNRHGEHVMNHYSAEGNHLLFEAQRMVYAGTFFPEIKNADKWRRSGIDVLNREIGKQVYSDGVQYELDLHYHPACVDIFLNALAMAEANGFGQEFPDSYKARIEKMIDVVYNTNYPDYTNPCFSDAKRQNRHTALSRYRKWSEVYPANEQIRYFATEGAEGVCPGNLSKAFPDGGFFVMRNGWDTESTVMVIKAGPAGEWHSQPDNGTFELWYNGDNLFPDSGSFIYAGDEEVMKLRNWFRSTKAHNTLTLDDADLASRTSRTLKWRGEGDVQVLVTENDSYPGLTHRRSVLFIDNSYFVIVDQAWGDAAGNVAVRYGLRDGEISLDAARNRLNTMYGGDNQMSMAFHLPKGGKLNCEQGWYSIAYRQRTERPVVKLSRDKKAGEQLVFATVLVPGHTSADASVRVLKADPEKNLLELSVNPGGKERKIKITQID